MKNNRDKAFAALLSGTPTFIRPMPLSYGFFRSCRILQYLRRALSKHERLNLTALPIRPVQLPSGQS